MKEIIENSKKIIKETSTLSRLELEKKKIELDAKTKVFAETFGLINTRGNLSGYY
ncbi:hypothetical protein I6N96_00725 [Enterococcus sp. BWM-S5]|uniref:Uncharacterized protein n=1 Tax=Enterococcus larvae TaxID=2794352 RepID=A0ABS4CG15_9ENTE|nr:hypothetical protein [Enterococcus larvae]MBP1044784.1 hypothetical protein [Enterococcus larvae]